MRLVQVLIPVGKRQPVLAVLDDEGIDYAVWDETGRKDFEALVQFPVPPLLVWNQYLPDCARQELAKIPIRSS